MIDGFSIRGSTPTDLQAIEAIYPEAFPNEDLLPLVRELLTCQTDVLSLIGTVGASVISHVIFTTCSVDGRHSNGSLLGPLAVAPAWQGKGAGSLIVRSGFQRLRNDGISHVFVLGDPAYYGRFGFSREAHVMPPYALPDEWREAWQSIELDDAHALAGGTIGLPEPWLHKKYWAP